MTVAFYSIWNALGLDVSIFEYPGWVSDEIARSSSTSRLSRGSVWKRNAVLSLLIENAVLPLVRQGVGDPGKVLSSSDKR